MAIRSTDIKTAVIQARLTSFKIPNTIAFAWDVWIQLVDHPDLLDRIKWSSTGVITEADMLRHFAPYGITRIIVGKAMRNGAVEGQTDSISSIWGKNVIIGYITPTPGLRTVNGGYTLRLRDGKYVDKWDERDPKGTWVRNNDYYDQMLFASVLPDQERSGVGGLTMTRIEKGFRGANLVGVKTSPTNIKLKAVTVLVLPLPERSRSRPAQRSWASCHPATRTSTSTTCLSQAPP